MSKLLVFELRIASDRELFEVQVFAFQCDVERLHPLNVLWYSYDPSPLFYLEKEQFANGLNPGREVNFFV